MIVRPLEDQWQAERDHAAAVMGEPISAPRVRLPQRLIEQLTVLEAAHLLEDLDTIRPLIPVLEPTIDDDADPPPPSDAYYDGVKDGIRAHAAIHDGDLLVGALRKPIAQVLGQVDAYQEQRRWWRFG